MSKKKQKKKKGPHRWAKGVSGNPNGRPPVPPGIKRELAHVRLPSVEELRIRFHEHFDKPVSEIKAYMNRPDIPMLDRIICSVMVRAGNGDHRSMDCLLDRVYGAVLKRYEFQGEVQHNVQIEMAQVKEALGEVIDAGPTRTVKGPLPPKS